MGDHTKDTGTIRIFLASSSELHEDRDEFDLYFRRQNDRFVKQRIYVEIIRWEYFLDAMSETRMQDEYNKAIRDCDIFVCLFFTKAGRFTEEEFEVAFGTFKEKGKPRIYTFFKEGSVNIRSLSSKDLLSLEAFQKKLSDLGHFYTYYSNVEDLKLRFGEQLNKLIDHEAAASVIPALHQIPPPPGDFTGREEEIKELITAVSGGSTITGLQGQGGVGKTVLALKVSEKLAPSFPDAQIYLNLLGVNPKPVTPGEAMAYVIRAFQPEAKLPEGEDELGAVYRSMLHGKHVLLLMDNAKDAAQVKPLVPPAGCVLLVTSRVHFTLPGLHAKDLNTLPPNEAEELLLKIAPRIDGEAQAIVKLCGCLPQALRLAATALLERVNIAPSDYRQRLAEEQNRPKLLAAGNEGVEASISLSYGLLDAEAQKRWRMLGVFPEAFDGAAAAAIWSVEKNPAEDTLGLLTQYSMLEWNEKARRYRIHDLMRDFARQKLSDEEKSRASLRHALHYLAVLGATDDFYLKGGASVLSGLALFDLERTNIEAGQGWAATRKNDAAATEVCNRYPGVGVYCLSLRHHPRDRIRWLEAGLAAARRLQDKSAEGVHLSNLGLAYDSLGEYRRAIEYYENDLKIAREIGDRRGEGYSMGGLGNAYYSLGESGRAIEYYTSCLEITHEMGDRRGEGYALGSLGNAYDSLGDYRRAIEYYKKCLEVAREIGDRQGESATLGNLGSTFNSLGEYRRAIEYHEKQLKIAREIGDRLSENTALWNLALAFYATGKRQKAIEYAEASLKIHEEIEDPFAERVRKQIEEWRRG